MDLEKYYLGTDYGDDITMEQARDIKILGKFRCYKGKHLIKVPIKDAENIIENEYCWCCQMIENKKSDDVACFYEDEFSLFKADIECLDGEIHKLLSFETSNYINKVPYKSSKKIGVEIDGKHKEMTAHNLLKMVTEQSQDILAKNYLTQDRTNKEFIIVKCEACGLYQIIRKDKLDLHKLKCDFCKEFVHLPFAFGRWLEEQDYAVYMHLEAMLGPQEFERVYRMDKNSTKVRFLVDRYPREVYVTPFEVVR